MASIAVIGTGYVGLTTGVCFAHLGHDVVCADVVPEKVERLSRGEATILERGLDDLLREGIKEGRLRFVLGAEAAVPDAEFVYLCVPTPQGPDGSADMSYIEDVARAIAPVLAPDTIVVNKSTVPVGSTRLVEQNLGRSDIPVVSNPEFLREGSAISDFLKPDRVVIGSEDQSAAIRVAALYIGVPAPLMVTDPASAETIKYASNAFLATKLSFVNAVAAVCEAVGADVNDVVLGMGYDKRIGSDFLKPGPGWGGSCFVGSETVLARRGEHVRLLTFEAMAAEVAATGAAGWEVYAWAPDEPTPAFFPISAFTERPWDGDVIEVRTTMGRRVTVTPDHPFVVGDGTGGGPLAVLLAEQIEGRIGTWLPVAQGSPFGEGRSPLLDWADVTWSPATDEPGALDFHTVSAARADAVLRFLGDQAVMAEHRPGPVHRVRIGPDGYRRLGKGAAWVRVTETRRRSHAGPVYSVEVPGAHTVVTTAGLIAHNCFPKDTRAMLRIAQDGGYDFNLLQGVLAVNDEQFERTTEKIVRLAGGSVDGVSIAVWGLTFKAGTDDLRESPSLEVIDRLIARGARVRAHDPTVTALPSRPEVELAADPYAACEGAAVLAVLTEWDDYKWLDLDKVASALAQPRVVDGRNLLDRSALLRRGFTYAGIGRS
jgi:UDP-glucose 6-dehydrogenase